MPFLRKVVHSETLRLSEIPGLEALMWRAESDPRMRSTICSLALLDRAPEWERFVAACEWGTRMAPRFRQKVVEPAFGLGTPCWVNDPKLHDSTTDGMGGFQLFSKLHSRKREHDPDKPQPAAPPPEWISPTDLLVEQMSRDARTAPGEALKNAGGLIRALGRPGRTLRDASRFVASLSRVVADPDAEGSPLLRERSLSWRFLALDVTFAELRAAVTDPELFGKCLEDGFAEVFALHEGAEPPLLRR